VERGESAGTAGGGRLVGQPDLVAEANRCQFQRGYLCRVGKPAAGLAKIFRVTDKQGGPKKQAKIAGLKENFSLQIGPKYRVRHRRGPEILCNQFSSEGPGKSQEVVAHDYRGLVTC